MARSGTIGDSPGVRWDSADSPLRVSAYDRVVSMVYAMLLIVGVLVFVLFVTWLGLKVFTPYRSVPIKIADVGGGVENGVVGESMQLDSPDPSDVPQVSELQESQLEQTLATVTTAVSRIEARLDNPALDTGEASGGARSTGTGTRLGRGSGDGPTGFPRSQRWEIRLGSGSALAEYARQLDHFGIELGAVGFGGNVEYGSRFSTGAPRKRVGERAAEDRVYFSWRNGTRIESDRQLMASVGIETEGKIVVQFYPADVENMLAQLEVSYANRQPSEIRRTIFGVRPDGGGYQFYVIEQTY